MNTVQLIIPAAGFGTRVGRPHAKELHLNPQTGRPLIELSLQLAKQCKYSYHLITRKEKSQLVEFVQTYAKSNDIPLSIQFVEIIEGQSGWEWPRTVYESRYYWQEKNILILPDTEFAPTDCLPQLAEDLNHCDCSFATFLAHNPEVWGCLYHDADQTYSICEKPATAAADTAKLSSLAWGIIGFRKKAGELLFPILQESNQDRQWKKLKMSCRQVRLEFFKDLTR